MPRHNLTDIEKAEISRIVILRNEKVAQTVEDACTEIEDICATWSPVDTEWNREHVGKQLAVIRGFAKSLLDTLIR